MNKRTKSLDLNKLDMLPVEVKVSLGHYLVRHWKPLLINLSKYMDQRWLASMGYLYYYTNDKGFSFTGTVSHLVKHESKENKFLKPGRILIYQPHKYKPL
jgi:hypothetical protein